MLRQTTKLFTIKWPNLFLESQDPCKLEKWNEAFNHQLILCSYWTVQILSMLRSLALSYVKNDFMRNVCYVISLSLRPVVDYETSTLIYFWYAPSKHYRELRPDSLTYQGESSDKKILWRKEFGFPHIICPPKTILMPFDELELNVTTLRESV